MGNCYTLQPQDPNFQGGVYQPRKNLFRQSQDSFSWQNGQEQVVQELYLDQRQPSGFYDPHGQMTTTAQKDLRQPVVSDDYPRVSDWGDRSGVKQNHELPEFHQTDQSLSRNHRVSFLQQQNKSSQVFAGWSPDSNPIPIQDRMTHSSIENNQPPPLDRPFQWDPLQNYQAGNQNELNPAQTSSAQFVSLTPSGNGFLQDTPHSPVGEASVFQIGGRSHMSTHDKSTMGIRFAAKEKEQLIKQQNQQTISRVMISRLPDKPPTVVARCQQMHPESYAVQVTRTELPLQSYGNFGKKREDGPYLLSDGGTYLGSVEREHPHGKGKWIGKDGQVYEGSWKNGLWHGEGRFVSVTGDIYQGSWEDGKRSGKGLMQLLSGYLYRGQWQDDLPHGIGHQRDTNGDEYDGLFVMGIKHGPDGVLRIAATGDVYAGKFEQGVMEYGKVSKAVEMEEYDGWLKYGLYEGVGELRNSEGVYNGEFLSGRRHGKGCLIYDAGNMEYQGSWKWGKQDGQGKLVNKTTGKVEKEGFWKGGKFVNADVKFGKSSMSSQYSTNGQDISITSWF